jgi:D-aminoacyl-tRNA deacylase
MNVRESRPIIVGSKADLASLNIAQTLISQHGFTKVDSHLAQTYANGRVTLVIIERECIYAEPADIPAGGSTIIFASKHVSARGKSALTVHATGNLTGEAKFGGMPREVSHVQPFRIGAALRTLTRESARNNRHIEITMEATHHGPTSLPAPVCFVEIGSGLDEWTDPTLAQIAARAVMAAADDTSSTAPNAVGFGGTHYSAKHTSTSIEGKYQVGHIVSRYALEDGVLESTMRETFAKTAGGCETAIVDWKGLNGSDRRRLVQQLQAWRIRVVRI